MSDRIEPPVIHMGRDSHHYFVCVSKDSPGAVQYVRGDIVNDAARALLAASHALRSYQYGNTSTELAESIADAATAALRTKYDAAIAKIQSELGNLPPDNSAAIAQIISDLQADTAANAGEPELPADPAPVDPHPADPAPAAS